MTIKNTRQLSIDFICFHTVMPTVHTNTFVNKIYNQKFFFNFITYHQLLHCPYKEYLASVTVLLVFFNQAQITN